ncbi:MAG: autotransporter outer membrane beta-barrel domain-containing protein [Xanthomonadaceae bacterium]|jgi:outer membrane autotransporter protein|nr:autotransporter outer membrane beta-barrel domain-containing protein [Xanthomonadaceae bacterium]
MKTISETTHNTGYGFHCFKPAGNAAAGAFNGVSCFRTGLRLSGIALALLAAMGIANRAEAQAAVPCGNSISNGLSSQRFFPLPGGTNYWQQSQAISDTVLNFNVFNCQFSIDTAAPGTLYDIVADASGNAINLTIDNGPAGSAFWTGLSYALIGDIDLSGRNVTDPAQTSLVTINGGGIGRLTGPSGAGTTVFGINGGHIETLQTGDGPNAIYLAGGTVGYDMRDGVTVVSSVGVMSGAGNDVITLDGAIVTGIDAGDGDNVIHLNSGTATTVVSGMGNDTVTLNGATVTSVVTGAGDDLVTINPGNTMTGLSLLDGGSGRDTLEIVSQTLTKGAGANEFWYGADNASSVDIVSFDVINLSGGSAMYFTDDRSGYAVDQLNIGDGSIVSLIDSDLTAYEHLGIEAGASLFSIGTNHLTGSLINQGVVDMRASTPGSWLHVTGNYQGDGVIYMHTYLGGDDSATDRLTIDGKVDGVTILNITPAAGSLGAQTVDGIVVVEVQPGAAAADAFRLASPLSAGLYNYGLYQASPGSVHDGSFVLKSNGLAPRVPVYLLSMTAAQSLALSSVGSMRDRGVAYESASGTAVRDLMRSMDGNSWSRLRYERVNVKRGQFALNQRELTFQAGFNLQEKISPNGDDGGLLRRGIMFSYGNAKGEIDDRHRPYFGGTNDRLLAWVGNTDTKIYSLGAYQTQFWNNGTYLDLVGQVGHLESKLSDIESNHTDTNGWNAYLSAELGRTIVFGARDWRVEPQAQLTVSKTAMNRFNDGEVYVAKVSQTMVRARAGVWLFNNFASKNPNSNDTLFYSLLNVWHDVNNPAGVRLDDIDNSLRLRPGSVRTWTEAGVGFQQMLNHERVTLFGDIRGQQALSAGSRDGLSIQFGAKVAW